MSTKTRGSRTFPLNCTYFNVHPSGDMSDSVPFGVSEINKPEGTFEIITDEEPGFKRYGNCSHTRRTGKWTHEEGVSITYPNEVHHHISDNSAWLPGFPAAPEMTGYDLNQLNAEAYLTMKPSLSCGFSITNFIIELAELKTMFKLFDRNKSIIKNAAGGHLNWSFGWKPFVNDVKTIYEQLSNFEKTLADYKSKQGREMVRHFKSVLTDDVGEVSDNGRTIQFKHTGVFHATMRYKYTVPALEQEHARAKALLDILGLTFNASNVWEGIPFSFVVDWFFGVGSYLESLNTDYLDSKVTILDYCYSVKIDKTHKYKFLRNDILLGNDIGEITVEQYTRKRTIPNAAEFGIVQSHRFGSKQAVLSLALLLA